MGNDQNRLMNAFNMLSGIEGSRYNQLAGLGGMYQGAVGGMADLYTGQANALSGIRMGSAGMANQLYGQMRPGPSFLDKLNQTFGAIQNGANTVSSVIGAGSALRGFQGAGLQNQQMGLQNQMYNQVMQSPMYMNQMGLGGAYGPVR
jgi:hypothetical protein